MCGEIAGDPNLTRILLGMGLKSFSMHPAHLLTVKQKVLTSNVDELRIATQKILRTQNPDRIDQLVDAMNV